MVAIKTLLKNIIGSLLLIMFFTEGKAQPNANRVFGKLDEYRNWGVHIGPSLYNKASSTLEYGKYSIENHAIPNFNFGFNYHFPLQRNWSIISGVWITPEPMFHLSYKIETEDLPYPYHSSSFFKEKGYGIYDFSIPILLNKNWHWRKKIFFDLQLGIKLMHFPHMNGDVLVTLSQNGNNRKEIFYMEMTSSENPIYSSAILGGGISFTLNNVIIHSTLYYVHNFKNIRTGYYKFSNFSYSPDSYGKYTLSGSYLYLQFAVRLRKSKKKLREMERVNNIALENLDIDANPFNEKPTTSFDKKPKTEHDYVVENMHPYSNYRNWGIHYSLDLYKKASSYGEYGNVHLTHHRTTAMSFGLGYSFLYKTNWSFTSGFEIRKEPIHHASYILRKEDLFPYSESPQSSTQKQFWKHSFSLPLVATYTIPINRRLFVDIIGGIKAMYYPKISFPLFDEVIEDFGNETKVILLGNIKSHDQVFSGSLIVGSGASFLFKQLLVQTNLKYIYNFRNNIEGEYKFINLLQSSDSGGKFNLSGDYLTLEFVFRLRKSQKQLDLL